MRALIADDNEDFVDMIQEMFVTFLDPSLNLEWDTAYDGKKALGLLLSHQYSFVILDVNLPSLTGYEILAKMKENASPNVKIPIIVISGNPDGQEDQAEVLSSFEKLYFVQKGGDISQLIRKLQLYMGPTLKAEA